MRWRPVELKNGDLAPGFRAKSTAGILTLDRFASSDSFTDLNIVLYFYLEDMGAGCKIQAREFTALYQAFKKLDTEIIGVSLGDIFSHRKFAEKEHIPYPVLVDCNGDICDLYDVVKDRPAFHKTYLSIKRATFLIGKDKKIFKVWRNVKPFGHARKVLKVINTMPTKKRKK
jgi:peroxiredoxin Q/BCP